MKTDADSLVRLGADYIYNLEFDKAEECFKQVINRYPALPAGYFLDAMVDWWKITSFRNTREFDNSFLKKIDKVIQVCDNILDTNEYEISALFFKGGAIGYRGRFHVVRENWFRAANDGYSAFRILIKCLEIAPNNYDIMLGTGIYNYFAEVLPEQNPAIKPLMLFAPKGDRKLGILQLHASAKYARYASVEAKLVLLQIYYDFEKDFFAAYNIAKELIEKYPNNPVFQRYYGRCLVSLYYLEEWEQHWKMILEWYNQKKPGYDMLTAREALYYVGSALFEKGVYEEALSYFYKCDEFSRKLDKDGPSAFMIYLNLKVGKIYDLQGKRNYAIMQYNKVLSWKNYRDSHEQAKRYLQIPYTR
ncbi:MAG: tetratricopeptide repeat protein [Ignavibacteria bacterium]|nr:tetratricopeptide repeat protein [Ignavibacteria bacterium]